MNSPLEWRCATPADLDAILTIQTAVHSFVPEPREIFADKMRHCAEGCLMLVREGASVGYGVAHPWTLWNIPPLNTLLAPLSGPADCLFVHDVALLPQARGQGAGGAFIARMSVLARGLGLDALALVSVYGTYPMWEKCGFAIQPSEPVADKLAGYGETARYMIARLDQR